MDNSRNKYRVRIRGDLACFTRPELKTERVSYDVITPSAARGVLEAVLWKPAIRWRLHKIFLLAPVRFVQFRRNEVNSRIPIGTVSKAMKTGGFRDFFADDDRAQRNTVALRDVDYAVEASFEFTEHRGPEDNSAKFDEMFRRRLQKGQFCYAPYLGCREFPAVVEPYEGIPAPLPLSMDLGWMLNDIRFGKRNEPVFFHSVLDQGVIDVPPLEDGETS